MNRQSTHAVDLIDAIRNLRLVSASGIHLSTGSLMQCESKKNLRANKKLLTGSA